MTKVVNVVPTKRTRRLAAVMVHDAHQSTGPDAALRHLGRIEPEQVTALVGLLLTQVKVVSKSGRPQLPLTLSAEDRLRGYSAWRRGDRSPFAELAVREYRRAAARARRARLGNRRAVA